MDMTASHILRGFVFAGAIGAFGCQGLQAPPPLALGQLGVNGLASDGDNLYWTMTSGDVRSISTAGGAFAQISNTVSPVSLTLSLDADSAYWATGTGEISRAPKTAGSPEVLVENANGLGALQVDDTNVYWLVNPGEGLTSGQLLKALKAEDAPRTPLLTMSSLHANTLTLSGASLYYYDPVPDSTPPVGAKLEPVAGIQALSTSGGLPTTDVPGSFQLVASATATLCSAGLDPSALALDPNATAWAVTCSALDGSNSHVVASGLTAVVTSIALDDDNVYFTTADGAVSSVPVSGNAPVDMSGAAPPDGTVGCVPGASSVCSCASDATGVLSCDSSGVGTCQCSGATTFAKGPAGPAAVALDQTSVYWAQTNGNAIFALPKL